MLERTHHVDSVAVEHTEELIRLASEGHSLLIAPNHADHADPHVLVRAAAVTRLGFHFMAAREGFEKSAAARFSLQSMGAFSVDREGNDMSAVRMAMQIIQEGRFPLVMFPEGEIWHHHEVLDELNEGVATIAIRAAAKLSEGKKAYVIPTALHYRTDESAAETFSSRLDRLEDRIAWKPRPDLPVVDRIYRLGQGMVALKEVEYLGAARPGDLVERLRVLQNELVALVEARQGVTPATDHVPARVKHLRHKIRGQLGGEDEEVDRDGLYADLDTLFVAIQAYSYPGRYLKEAPTTGRIAETLLKLEEDVLGEGTYPAARYATVRFGEAICIGEYLEEHGFDRKTAVGPMTEEIGRRIQTMLDACH